MSITKRILSASVAVFATSVTALAADKAIIVMDASGSMWGQIEGKTKIEIARETLGNVIGSFPDTMELGLIAYGHREKGVCADIEQIIAPGTGNRDAISSAVNGLNPKGKTPLSDAVTQAAESLKYTEDKATVILITDGIETCDADPCAVATALENQGVDFTAHVVGFGLSKEEGQQVACLAENTGGKYIEAKDAGGLAEALTEVAEAPAPPPPEPKPDPVAIEDNVTFTAIIGEGAEGYPIDGKYEFFQIVDGKRAEKNAAFGYDQNFTVTLEPGDYVLEYTKNMVRRETTFSVLPGERLDQTLNLDAGVINVAAKPTADGEVNNEARYDVTVGDKTNTGYGPGTIVVPAGEVSVDVRIGQATASDVFTIAAGQIIDKTLVAEAGRLTATAVYAAGTEEIGNEVRFDVLGAKKSLDGKRKTFSTSYGNGDYMLPPGDYIVVARVDAAEAEMPVTVTGGALEEVVVDMNAGILAVSAPGSERVDILSATKDLSGKQKSFHVTYAEEFQIVAHPGEYTIKVRYDGDTEKLVNASVEAAARAEVEIQP